MKTGISVSFGHDLLPGCGRRTDWRTPGQNYDNQYAL